MSAAAIDQDLRLIHFNNCILHAGNFSPISMQGKGTISSCYVFILTGRFTPSTPLDLNKLLCTPFSCTLHYQQQAPTHLHGLVTHMAHSIPGGELIITMSPWLSVLKNTCNCRIFQNQTIPDIVHSLFKEHSFSHYDFSGLTKTYQEHLYITQFNESDYDFITRLLSAEGIYYYFKHAADKHTLILVDSELKTPLISSIFFDPTQAYSGTQINSMRPTNGLTVQTLSQQDYNPATPNDSLITQAMVSHPRNHPWLNHLNHYEYPGGFGDSKYGQLISQIKLDAMSCEDNYIIGHSDCDQFMVGSRFKLQGDDIDHSYLITELSFDVQDPSNLMHAPVLKQSQLAKHYRNRFKAHVVKTSPYRPRQNIPKPKMGGVHTATVIGPEDQTIHMNKDGRIQVQFHWDLADNKGDHLTHNTAWLRVSQQMASQQAGTFFNPRVGQEVLVSYLDGDLDRPLIVGSVYNNEHKPNYRLPAQQWVSGIKTDAGHEISFNDTPGSESVWVNSVKDYQQNITGNYFQSIQGNSHSTIEKGNHTVTSHEGEIKISTAQYIRLQVHESTLVITPEGITINSPKINIRTGAGQAVTPGAASDIAEGEHWVQGHYVNAPEGMPYMIEHSDGSVFKGTLNHEGKTDKITHLTPGLATIHFGDKAALEARLVLQRAQLQSHLDKIIQHVQSQASHDKQLLRSKPWWDKVYLYGKGFTSNMAQGAIDVTKSTGHLIASMYEGASDAIALEERYLLAAMTGNQQDMDQISQTASQKSQAIIAKFNDGYHTLEMVRDDTKTHAILQNFAQDYYDSMDGLMLLKDVGSFVGGFIPAIILAVITKNPEALGAAESGETAGLVNAASDSITSIEKTNQQLQNCVVITDIDMDKMHVIGPPPEPGAVHVSQAEQLDGYETKEDLKHPESREYDLDAAEASNFHGEPKPAVLKGESMVRFYDPDDPLSLPNGRYWIKLSDMPKSKAEWRSHFAVSSWNKDGGFVIFETPETGVNIWEGTAASQKIEGSEGWIQRGGSKQLLVPDSQNDIPLNKLEFHKSSEIWSDSND